MRAALTLRALGYWAYQYKRTWRGTVVTSVLNPVLFLAAMGVGLGTYVGHGHRGLGGVSYLVFLAPGLLAANAMQTAAGEATWPVRGAIKWVRTYHAMLATPLRVADVLLGHLLWIIVRITLVSAVFFAIMAAFGGVRSPSALLALPAAVLTGVAFTAPIMAFAAAVDRESGLSTIFRFGIIPLFLFSGTFFPVDQLPAPIRPLAYVTPLYHGVSLCRSLALGTATAGAAAVHVGYLLALIAVGVWLARLTYRRRLTV